MSDGPEIRVGTSELREIAGQLRKERDEALDPHARRAATDFSAGVPFGARNASGEVHVAKKVYAQALERTINTLDAYAQQVEQFAAASSQAADNYERTDRAAAVRLASTQVLGKSPGAAPLGSTPALGGRPPGFVGPVPPSWAAGPAVPQAERPAAWCTNWDAYNIYSLTEMVEGDNIAEGRNQVQTWSRIETALTDQLGRLRRYRQAITDAWSPDHSEAARTFVQSLDSLIDNMTLTESAAARNKHSLDGILNSLESAREQLKPMLTNYKSKADDWKMRSWDHAEDEINQRARLIMSQAELSVRDYHQTLTVPPLYIADERDPGLSGNSGNQKGSSAGRFTTSPASHSPPAPLPGVDPRMPDGQQWTPGGTGSGSGPVLSGVETLPGHTGTPGGGPLPGAGGGFPGGSGAGGYGGAGGLGPIGGVGGFRGGPGAGSGRGAAFRPGTSGGVIGGSGAGGRSGGGMPGMGAGAGHGPGGQRRAGDGTGRGEADVEWEVAEGVAPITEAPKGNHRHDPGPGVIGIDR